MSAKRLPPGGKKFAPMTTALAARRRCGGSVILFTGPAAWEAVADHGETFPWLLLPRDADPRGYSWPVDGWSILIYDTGTEESVIQVLAMTLAQAGAGFTFWYMGQIGGMRNE